MRDMFVPYQDWGLKEEQKYMCKKIPKIIVSRLK